MSSSSAVIYSGVDDTQPSSLLQRPSGATDIVTTTSGNAYDQHTGAASSSVNVTMGSSQSMTRSQRGEKPSAKGPAAEPATLFPPNASSFFEQILAAEKALMETASKNITEEFENESVKSRRLQQLHSQRERRNRVEEEDAKNEAVVKELLEHLGDAIRDRETTLRSDGYQTYLFGNEDLYEGDWKNSKMHGRGVMRSNHNGGQIYEGEWFLGTRNGQGTLHALAINTTYDGKWSEGKRHGKGELTEPEGVYRGEFREGKIQGLGEYVYVDGHIYRGEWRNEEYHGNGVYVYPSGTKYDGAWRNGLEHGRGTRVYRNGDVYSGEWVSGRKHGVGTYSCVDFHYDGEWQYNQIEGKGTCKFADGATYNGSWAKGQFHGKGVYTDAKGRTYNGDFISGRRHGEGTYEGDGITYTGPWVRDKKVGGEGSMAFISGGVYTGPWKDDLPHGKGVFDTVTGIRDRVTYADGVCVERDDSMSFKKYNAELEINMILSPEAERKSRVAAKKRREALEGERQHML